MSDKLFTIDEKTQLPIPTAEALILDSFSKAWKRVKKIDGDADGRKKTFNTKELGYVYFQVMFDPRLKLKEGTEREIFVKRMLALPDDWSADEVIKQCIEDYREWMKTPSSEYVSSLEGTVGALAKYLNNAKAAISIGTMESVTPKDVKDLMSVINDSPTMLDTVVKAKAVLQKERDALATGRKGRSLNKFEMPQ